MVIVVIGVAVASQRNARKSPDFEIRGTTPRQEAERRRTAHIPDASSRTTTRSVPTSSPPREQWRLPGYHNVDWPVDDETGEVFDDAWLRDGTTGHLTRAQLDRVWRAAISPGIDQEPTTKAEEAEYYRATRYLLTMKRLETPGTDGEYNQHARMVRGRDLLEWREHVEHLSRLGRYEQALALNYECSDAAERINGAEGAAIVKRSSILLRKMKDYEADVRLMQDAIVRFPRDPEFVNRLKYSAARLAKQAR